MIFDSETAPASHGSFGVSAPCYRLQLAVAWQSELASLLWASWTIPRLVFCAAWRDSSSWAQAIIFFIFVIVGAASLVPSFGMTIDASGLLALLGNPKFFAILFGAIVLTRLLCAPYWIWSEERAARIKAELQVEELAARYTPSPVRAVGRAGDVRDARVRRGS
jgi:hypothetical protein